VFFLLIRYVKKSGRIFNILFIAGIISAVLMGVLFKSSADPTRVYYGTDTRLFSILLGTGLAFVWPSWKMKARMKPQPKKFLNRVGLVSLILIIASFVFLADNWTFVYRGGMYLFSLISMVFVALVAHPGLSWNKWLTNPVFTYIGKRSYGIYLWQFPIMIFYEAKVNDVGNHVVLHTIVELILIFGISELSYRFVEQPLKKLDYSTVIPKLKELFQAPYLERDKIIGYVISVITLVALVGIIISPVNGKSPDQKALEESIATNKAKNEQHQKEVEKAESENKPAVVEIDPEATLSKRYDLTKQQLNAASKMKITAFGDSVMLASSDDLNEVFPYMMIDADVGRQLYNSYDALQKLKTDGELADTVLVSLGTNGSFTQQQFDDFMKIIGKKREVYWMSVRVPTKRWQNTVNDMLKDEEKKYSNLHLVDWYKLSEAQKDWFYPDKVHPNDTGKPYYTRLVAQSLLTKENVAKVEASEKAAKEKEAAEKKAKADAAKGTSSTSSSAKKTSSSTKKAN
jgi:Ca2+/Na+ antiporter